MEIVKTITNIPGAEEAIKKALGVDEPRDPAMRFDTKFTNKCPGCKRHRRPDPRDPNDERDDLHRTAPCLCELGGLIRRARRELADGNWNASARTLGRAQEILDAEVGK